jgi:ribosomal protein L21E
MQTDAVEDGFEVIIFTDRAIDSIMPHSFFAGHSRRASPS